MKLFDVLTREAPNRVFVALSLGVLTGFAYTLLIPLILMSLEDLGLPGLLDSESQTVEFFFVRISHYKFAAVFFLTCIFIAIMKTISQTMSSSVSLDATLRLRLDIYRKLSRIPIAELEKLGPAHVMALLTNDVPRVITGAQAIPDAIITGITVVGVLGFLAIVDFVSFVLIVGSIVMLLFAYHFFLSYGQRYYVKSRHFVDKLHGAIRGLTLGAKELKLNNKKRAAFFSEGLAENEIAIKNNQRTGFLLMQAANNFADMINFLMVGVATFVLVNYRTIDQVDLYGIIVVLIYFIGPLEGFLRCLPLISVAKVSLARLNKLLGAINNEEIDETTLPKPTWSSIRLENIIYRYQASGADPHETFQVGPVSLEVNKGEITFLAGGNGSGKSTLAKLVSLHYIPTSGSVSFDGVQVTRQNVNLYRQEISAIYTDYFLFEKIFGYENEVSSAQVDQYLTQLELEKKVTIGKGTFSTLSLSDGQKRRLALVVAFLENNNFYIFDEWAADQDPTFKEVFYYTILPDLKRKGKAVLVVSHDDRFYDVADKIIYMDSGTISKVVSPLTKAAAMVS